MTLFLQGIALNDEPMSQPLIGRFDERGGTLGRSDTATFTLPDPERIISRIQAQVLYRDDGYWIENMSAANPILHNGLPLSAGMRIMLRAGDELRIGGYTLRTAFEDDEASATLLRGRTTTMNLEGALAAMKTERTPTLRPTTRAEAQRNAQPSPRPAIETGIGDESLWREFLEGAGLEFLPSDGPPPELLRAVGAMMRIAVGGIHSLVAMRAMAKDDIQAEMTLNKVRSNNPLKFAPDAAAALQLLLEPPARGFLDGPAALRDALVDLQAQQAAIIAAMRAALEAVLERFDPAKIESLLTTRSLLEALRPAHHKARLWELYLEHYDSLRDQARQDFQRFFGKAFREAYAAQARSLEAASGAAARVG